MEIRSSDAHEVRREEILAAAERCVQRDGLRNLRLRDLARESGQSLGNFYNYFRSKEDLIEALVEREVDRFCRIAMLPAKDLPEGARFGERLRCRLQTFVEAYLESEGARMMISIANEALVNPRVREVLQAANKRLRDHMIRSITDDRDIVLKVSPEVLEVRVQMTRSFLESARILLIFNPDLSPEVIRDTLVERLFCMLIGELSFDNGLRPQDIIEHP